MDNSKIVRPVQPSFVLGSSYFYKKDARESPYSRFYQFECVNSNRWVHIVPDVSLDIIFQWGPDGEKVHAFGLALDNWPVIMQKDTTFFGVRFLPGLMPKGWRRFIPQLVHGIIPIEALGLKRSIFGRLSGSMEFSKKIDVFRNAFSNVKYEFHEDALLTAVLEKIYEAGGNISIEEICTHISCGRRYVHKLFTKYMGISPKTFCKTIKFQKALQILNQGEYHSLSDVASTTGYYDQSFFTNEFRRYTTLTPLTYGRMIRENGYAEAIREF